MMSRAGERLYCDSAAMSLRPAAVIEAVAEVYARAGANVHRGGHADAEAATDAFEDARSAVASFLSAAPSEIVFTGGCTNALNLVAAGLELGPGDEVVVSELEHHSNLLPWRARSRVRTVATTAEGTVDLVALAEAITPRTRVLAMTHASNVSGVVQPVAEVCALARARGVVSVVDAAQTVGHIPVSVEEIGCDFLAFSGHKALGPSGVGVLYGRAECLAGLRPSILGGGMVEEVGAEGFRPRPPPHGLEAGTPPIEGAIGLAAALRYVSAVGLDAIAAHNTNLAARLYAGLAPTGAFGRPFAPREPGPLPTLCLTPRPGPLDASRLALILSDTFGVGVRAGVFCCQPLFERRGVPDALRVSLHFYNGPEDVDRVASAFSDLARLLRAGAA